MPQPSLYAPIYQLHDDMLAKQAAESASLAERETRERRLNSQFHELQELPALSSFITIEEAVEEARGSSKGNAAASLSGSNNNSKPTRDGFERMRRCRMALDALDQGGWKRSYHQRLFHEAYIAACARPFWKIDPLGSFARAHQKILDINNWDNLAQEILISTPRRFGKTISVSMFAAALMFSCAGCEVSIYSTCKRISTKLLRNVTMFLGIIYDMLKCEHLKVIRANQEEVHLQGDEGYRDVRIIQSYPSKVRAYLCMVGLYIL